MLANSQGLVGLFLIATIQIHFHLFTTYTVNNRMEDSTCAALILFAIAFPGMICNWFIVLFSYRTRTLNNAFGRFLSAQAVGEAVHLTLFTFFVTPVIFFELKGLLPASAVVGHILLVCYDICIYCHLAISINRLFAIVFPFAIDKVFSKNKTVFTISLCYLLAIAPSIYFYQFADCSFVLNFTYWEFSFLNTPECVVIMWYADFMKYIIIVTIIVVVDLFTLSRVHAFTSKLRMQNGSSESPTKSRELNFLKQACLQAAVFVFELITYFVLPQFFEDRWTIFLLTTVPWVGVHTTDAIITIYFNKELQRIIAYKIVSLSGIHTRLQVIAEQNKQRQNHVDPVT